MRRSAHLRAMSEKEPKRRDKKHWFWGRARPALQKGAALLGGHLGEMGLHANQMGVIGQHLHPHIHAAQNGMLSAMSRPRPIIDLTDEHHSTEGGR